MFRQGGKAFQGGGHGKRPGGEEAARCAPGRVRHSPAELRSRAEGRLGNPPLFQWFSAEKLQMEMLTKKNIIWSI